MRKIDPVVKRETLRIALGTIILSAVMELVFVLLGKWSIEVLLGNLLGAFTAVFNFFLICLTVTGCVSMPKEKAVLRIRASQYGRLLLIAGIAAIGALAPCFNLIAVLVPLLFPSIIIVLLRLTGKADTALPAAGADDAAEKSEGSQDEYDTEETDD